MRPVRHAAMPEKREWPGRKIRLLTSCPEHSISMRVRSRPDPRVHNARQASAVSSAIKLATVTGIPSLRQASRTQARTSSARANSSTSRSSEKETGEGDGTTSTPLHRLLPARPRRVASGLSETSTPVDPPTSLPLQQEAEREHILRVGGLVAKLQLIGRDNLCGVIAVRIDEKHRLIIQPDHTLD